MPTLSSFDPSKHVKRSDFYVETDRQGLKVNAFYLPLAIALSLARGSLSSTHPPLPFLPHDTKQIAFLRPNVLCPPM